MINSVSFLSYEVALDGSFYTMLVIVFIAGLIRGFTGFGSALLTVPALAVLYGPTQAVVIEVLIEIPVALGFLPLAIRHAERKTVMPILFMFMLFVPLGTLLLTVVNADYVRIFMSVFVLCSLVLIVKQKKIASMFSNKIILLVGAISGSTQGLTGMAGPLFATALLARGETAQKTRANITALAGGIIALSVISLIAFGLITTETLFYSVLASPSFLLGCWSGAVGFHRLSHLNLRAVIIGFLAISAMTTLIQTLA